MSCKLVKNTGSGPPKSAIGFGWQNDGSGQYFSAVAQTEDYGPVGGKAQGQTCWYPFGGEEKDTKNFSWLTGPERKIVPVKNTGSPPSGAVSIGPQRNEDGDYYAAVALSDYGTVPGKAKGDRCWYSWGGQEYYTSDFFWVVWKG